MEIRLFLPLLISGLSTLASFAQYDQDIDVEGTYVPEYIARDRIGMFPVPVRPEVKQSLLDFDLRGTDADFLPCAVPIPATGWQTTRKWNKARGYADLSLGSWLNADLSAGYRIIESEKSKLGVRLQYNSTSLWKPRLAPDLDTRMRRFDGSLGLWGSHKVQDRGRLDAALDYHLGNFNYYGWLRPEAPTQTLNDIAARIAWQSESEQESLRWNTALGVRSFNYRTGDSETDLRLNAGLQCPASSESSFVAGLDAGMLFYSERKDKYSPLMPTVWERPDNYGNIALSPAYRLSKRGLDLRIGARIDLTFNAGTHGDRYRVFHIAPDVKVDWTSGPATIFAHFEGGCTSNTLAAGYQSDYYQNPYSGSTMPVYSPLDAKAGVRFGPFSGFHIGGEFAYRIEKGQYLDRALFMPLINGETLQQTDPRSDLSGWSASLEAGYDAGRWFKINARASYQPQNGKKGWYNGLDRARWTARAEAVTNPWRTLEFRLSYDFRGVRCAGADSDWRLPDITDLNLAASYGITDALSVWIEGRNLLGTRSAYLPGLPTPGVSVSAGLGVTF